MRVLDIVLLIFALYHNIQAQNEKPEACSQPPEEGTGSDSRVYMYYDKTKDQCLLFRYNGEGGNANRFIAEKHCMRNCSDRAEELFPMDEKKACTLPKLQGECLGSYIRYHYSPEHHTCKKFYWSGCVGNGNRFLTFNLCNDTCFNAADVGHEDHTDETDVPVGIILGVVMGLIGAIILIVVIVFAVKKPGSKKHKKEKKKEDAKTTEKPLKEEIIEMSGGEAQ
ncbi:BPTI/Kunitz domain-containing protein isoform X3 [Myxocyprinus asiaticus]|uniref:BPTI/Kunitz domain-containing protein isoform X2 n=1 Tax=Myxocyprinus asiaticus TaxID=70543 RepID=UPI0022238A47|nr:BPTI/Kunitz domain-containing protein isoform X2 [Myxocyprinus asiaticus]XP_051546216.1 BPTI/Kunitz domain-containing protein isoform X3 [Myxocyprinus asiaticus]